MAERSVSKMRLWARRRIEARRALNNTPHMNPTTSPRMVSQTKNTHFATDTLGFGRGITKRTQSSKGSQNACESFRGCVTRGSKSIRNSKITLMHHVSSLCLAWLASCKLWVSKGVRGHTKRQATVEAEGHSNNSKRLARNAKLSVWARGAATPDVKKNHVHCATGLARAPFGPRAPARLQRIGAPRNPKL